MNKPVLGCRALSKSFTDGVTQTVLNDIEMSVGGGEAIAILGASGSGKTTLLHLLGGLDSPDVGSVEVEGIPLSGLSDAETAKRRNEYLAFVFQFHLLLPEFSALENVAMPLLLRRHPRAEALAAAAECLRLVNLEEHGDKTPEKLSGGERQRVAVARAIISQPRCILADEPTGNLDRHNADHVFNTLLSVCRNRNMALIFVSHDERLAQRADRILFLENGKLEEKT